MNSVHTHNSPRLNYSVVLSHWVNRHPPPEVTGELTQQIHSTTAHYMYAYTHTTTHTRECTAQACKSHSQCSYQWIPRSRLKVIAITTVQSAGTTFHTVCEGIKVSSLIGIVIKTNSPNNSVVLSHWVNRHPPL